MMQRIAYRQTQAEEMLGMGEGWLDEAPIPRCDIRKPGAKRPVWVWHHDDLVEFIRSRRVAPGHPSPFGG